MNIFIIASEIAPFSKTGGLGDVVAALPKELANNNLDVFVFTPLYRFIKTFNYPLKKILETETTIDGKKFPSSLWYLSLEENPAIFFIEQEELFQDKIYTGKEIDNLRFFFFNKTVLNYIETLGIKPDIVHCHDWQTGLIPNFIRNGKNPFFKNTATLFTVHNLLFQKGGDWWSNNIDSHSYKNELPPTDYEKILRLNFMRIAIKSADMINTVSERYAQEILTPEFGQGLQNDLLERKDDLFGIINGIDTNIYNPASDNYLYQNYSWWNIHLKKENKKRLRKNFGLEENPKIPLIGAVNRLTDQKGFDLILESFEEIMKKNLQLAIVGTGDAKYIANFQKMQDLFKTKFVFINPFTEEMASKIFAASDLFIMPSRFEPCGLSQLISLRYGSIPIVHQTGGLADTIKNFDPRTDSGNGFSFTEFSKKEFLKTLDKALEYYENHPLWHTLMTRAMRQVFSWELPAKKYFELYKMAIGKKLKNLNVKMST